MDDAPDTSAHISSADLADLLEKNLARQTEAVRAADFKMALLVPTTSAMLGVLAALYSNAPASALTATAFHAALVPLILVFILIAVSVVPRLRRSPTSLLFFGQIMCLDPDAFHGKVRELDWHSYHKDLTEQCYTVAAIAQTKHRIVRAAYIGFVVSLPLWGIAIWALSQTEG